MFVPGDVIVEVGQGAEFKNRAMILAVEYIDEDEFNCVVTWLCKGKTTRVLPKHPSWFTLNFKVLLPAER